MKFDRRRLQQALAFAAKCHSGQERTSGTPYIVHPADVQQIVLRNQQDFGDDLEDALVTAALHDVLEDDKQCRPEDIEAQFGSRVLNATRALSKDTSIKDPEDALIDSLDRSAALGSWVVGVKAADRISNLNPITIPLTEKWNRLKMISYLNKESAMILWAVRREGLTSIDGALESAMRIYGKMIPSV